MTDNGLLDVTEESFVSFLRSFPPFRRRALSLSGYPLLFLIHTMKTFRITYTIIDGEHEYADEIVVSAEEMTDEQAVRRIADFWVSGETSETRALFRKVLVRENFSFLPGATRAIKKIHWEEIKPILITVRKGMIEEIKDIPDGVEIKVVDWDTDELDAASNPVPAVIIWDSSGEYATAPGDD
jgi:hypothetical protein